MWFKHQIASVVKMEHTKVLKIVIDKKKENDTVKEGLELLKV